MCVYVYMCLNVCSLHWGGYGLANSRGDTLRDWAGCGHREEVVESTISLPLHTVGTWCPLAEAGKTRSKGGDS